MTTVRQFKTLVMCVSRVSDHREFCRLSDGHLALWKRLNALGNRGIPEDPDVKEPSDIDAAAHLAPSEERELLAEFHLLRRSIMPPAPAEGPPDSHACHS